MKARVGDRIMLASNRVSAPVRDGEIVEVRGDDGAPPYTVKWSDGHTGLFFPGGDSITVSAGEAEASAPAEPVTTGRGKQWQVQVTIFESGDDTSATAVLMSGATQLTARGETHRSAGDTPSPQIGDEVAVARALRQLADTLINTVSSEIEAATGEEAMVRPR